MSRRRTAGERVREARDQQAQTLRILRALVKLETGDLVPYWGGVFAVDIANATGIAPRSMGGILAGLHKASLIGAKKNEPARCNVYYLSANGHILLRDLDRFDSRPSVIGGSA